MIAVARTARLLALLVPASAAAATAQLPAVAVERRLADELALRVGDTIRLDTSPDSMRRVVGATASNRPPSGRAKVLRTFSS